MNLRNLCFLTSFILIILKAIGVATLTWLQVFLPAIIGIILTLFAGTFFMVVISSIFNFCSKYISQDENKKQ